LVRSAVDRYEQTKARRLSSSAAKDLLEMSKVSLQKAIRAMDIYDLDLARRHAQDALRLISQSIEIEETEVERFQLLVASSIIAGITVATLLLYKRKRRGLPKVHGGRLER
jgi:hypothetical protein